MKPMSLFQEVVPSNDLHQIFRLLQLPENAPERDVLIDWAEGMPDRDGKFVKEFQKTFESGLWELYLHACLKGLGHRIDFTRASPDFTVVAPRPFLLEATIAAPEQGGAKPFGVGPPELPSDLNEFNRLAVLRICNSFVSKVQRYRQYYQQLPDAADKPFVIAIAPFDRPAAHLASNRPIVAALYGEYYDEETTIRKDRSQIIHESVKAVTKQSGIEVTVGFFTDNAYADVSAVVYGPLATWGKLRALAKAPTRQTIFQTFHPDPSGLLPKVRSTVKADYVEDLFDGLYVFHNPCADRPLPEEAFDHPRVAQYLVNDEGTIYTKCPNDFLLLRFLFSVMPR